MMLFNFNMEVMCDHDFTDAELDKIKEDLFNTILTNKAQLVNLAVYGLVDAEGNSLDVPLHEVFPEMAEGDIDPDANVDYTFPNISKRLN